MKNTALQSSLMINLIKGVTLASILLAASSVQTFAQELNTSPIQTLQTNEEPSITPAPSELILTAIPPRLGDDLTLKAKPGQTIQTTVRVKNSSNQELTVKSLIEDFIIGADGKEPQPVSEATPSQWSLAKWMTITPPVNTLSPNESATINVLIEVPADALPGGKYAMIMHEPGSSDDVVGGAAAGISQRVGTLVYFVVEGDIYEEAYIRDLQTKSFSEFGPIPFSFTIENRSDIHIQPNVQIEISNLFGQKVDTLSLETQNIFPYTERAFETEWSKKWGFGRYTATVVANYGTQGKVTRGVISFWIFPLRIVLAILFGIGVIVTLFVFIKRRVTGKTAEKNREIETLQEKVKSLESQNLHQFKDDQN